MLPSHRRIRAVAVTLASHRRILAAIVPLLVGATGSSAAVELGAYLSARGSGVGGEIAGRVYEEGRKPSLPDRGLPNVAVSLLPVPQPLMRRLEHVKRGARDSDQTFRTAVPRMLAALQEHESDVRAAGGEGLLLGTTSGSDGTFTIPGVPEGAWLIVGREETVVPVAGSQTTKKDREMYRVGPPLTAYRSVRIWVREIAMAGGRVETVQLTDRNVWFRGVIESR